MNSTLTNVMYHYVRPIANSKYPGIKGLELSAFIDQIEYLNSNYNIITAEQVIDCIRADNKLPSKAMLLTFDDGYIDHYEYVFPVLKRFGLQGSFFVPTQIFENRMLDVNKIHYILACTKDINALVATLFVMLDECRERGIELAPNDIIYNQIAVASRWDPKEVVFVKKLLQNYLPLELRNEIATHLFTKVVSKDEADFAAGLYLNRDKMNEMKSEGMFFGLHGHAHQWLNKISLEEFKCDMNKGIADMEFVTDKDYLTMNYPYGGYNEDVVDYCKEMGCVAGFTVEARDAVIGEDDNMLLPRWDTNDFRR